ncbi:MULTISPECIES: hypothetical protein [unclassified Streptomyces]|uniref:hypothetical protein n=1 Tax=unclassified Streptomyces TaxID=2593676 RepID=UPI00339F490E
MSDKIQAPTRMLPATLTVRSGEKGERRFRLDDPWLELVDDAADEDRLTGWTDDAETDAPAVLAAGEGVSVRRLVAPATPPFAVAGGVRVIDRFRSRSGGLRVTPARPVGLRGSAARRASGLGPRAARSAMPSPTTPRARRAAARGRPAAV